MIQNIIFDVGNVLLEYNPQRSLDLFCTTGEEKSVIRRELFDGPEWVQGDLGNMTKEQKYESAKMRVPEHIHPALERCALQWSSSLRPIPGAREFLEYVKGRGFQIYLLSNASDEFYEFFPKFLPLDYFDGIAVSSDLHMVKPDIRIYRYLLNTYGLSAKECLFIDDTQKNLKGAGRVGIIGELFLNDFEKIKLRYGL